MTALTNSVPISRAKMTSSDTEKSGNGAEVSSSEFLRIRLMGLLYHDYA